MQRVINELMKLDLELQDEILNEGMRVYTSQTRNNLDSWRAIRSEIAQAIAILNTCRSTHL
jgi:hypothetical protein